MSIASKVVGLMKGVFGISVAGATLTIGSPITLVNLPAFDPGNLVFASAATISAPVNTAAALTIQDSGNNAYLTFDTRTTASGVKASLFGNAGPSIASASGVTYSSVGLSAYTLTLSGVTTVTNLPGLQLNIASPTVTNTSAGLTITTAATATINGPLQAGNAAFTNAYTVDLPAFSATGSTRAAGLRVTVPSGATTNSGISILGAGGTLGTNELRLSYSGTDASISNPGDGSVTLYTQGTGAIFSVSRASPVASSAFATSAGGGQIGVNAGTAYLQNGTGLLLTSGYLVQWNSDSGISRLGAASLAIGNGTAGDFSGALKLTTLTLQGTVGTYNGVATTGWGVPAIQGTGNTVGAIAAIASNSTYTVGAADGTFLITANILVTTATLHAFTATVAYTDESNTSRVLTLSFTLLAGGTLGTSIANANGAVPYEFVPVCIRAKAATAITVATAAGGTYTTVVYNMRSAITQIA